MTGTSAPRRPRHVRITRRRRVLAAGLLSLALAAEPVAAFADIDVNHLPPISDQAIDASVSPIQLGIYPIDVAGSVTQVAQTEQKGSDTLVRLSSDILFAFGRATLSPAATARIKSLIAKAPKRATVHVSGYTDNVGSTGSNLTLSSRRAKAVAAALHTGRPDLTLVVHGYGEADPVAPNSDGGKDDPTGRRKNRRVELRYRR